MLHEKALMNEHNHSEASASPSRRVLLQMLGALGAGTAVFQRSLAAQAQDSGTVTAEMILQAEWVAGIKLSEAARGSILRSLQQHLQSVGTMRQIKLDNSVPPALHFQTAAPTPSHTEPRGTVVPIEQVPPERPDSQETLAFMPISQLAALLRTRQISSMELTKLYLQRLRKADATLHCVVSFTEETALKQAEAADREIATGRYRGPLHGIPWGAKDLVAYPGYKTTWGAKPYQEQVLNMKATVANRLEDAGAVMLAKLTLGALAQGDRWFGGTTANPWNPREGSSGSSAGSAAATAAGLVGFGIGSETLGSIVSPSTRCGTTGLRPTFGRVSRYGCMALSWSMDKIGPLARSVEDCALVFGAIHGSDGLDPTAVDRPFSWPCTRDLRSFRIGYVESGTEVSKRPELNVLRDLGVKLVPIKLPDKYPLQALRVILTTEAAASFEDLTRQGVTDGLEFWLGSFRTGQFVTAVDYIRANRIRTLVMQEMEEVLNEARIDAYVGGNDLLLCNLTGHPTLVMPNGFSKRNGNEVPTSITFTGRLFGETELLALGHAYQQATGIHLRHPAKDKIFGAIS